MKSIRLDIIETVASAEVLDPKSAVPMPTGILRMLAFFFCAALTILGDQLIPKKPQTPGRYTRPVEQGDVVVQAHTYLHGTYEGLEYWYAEDGIIRKADADADQYTASFAPENLEVIRDQWKNSGATIEIQYRDGRTPLRLNNCSLAWRPPDGYQFTLFAPDEESKRTRGHDKAT